MDENLEVSQKKLLAAICEAEREQADQIVIDWAEKNGYPNTFIHLFEPVMMNLGKLWVDGQLSLAQGYVAGLVAEDVFVRALDTDQYQPRAGLQRPVVIGNIEDDYHSLGRKLISIFLKATGWQVYDLGNDVIAEEFVDKAIGVGANVIGVSAMMYTTAQNIKKLREEIDRRQPGGKIQLAVGGAIFKLRPELVAEVGGDGTADNAISACNLFEQLWQKAQLIG